MKTLQQIVNENNGSGGYSDKVKSMVNLAIEKSGFKGNPWFRVPSSDFANVSFTFGKDKSEFSNGIIQNDNLNLSFTLEPTKDGGYVLEWNRKSATGKPTKSNMVYDSYKFKISKITAKSEDEFVTKLSKAFIKVKEEVKKLLDDGVFDLHKEFKKPIERFVQ
jgi:hypothetical protein